MPQTQAMEKEFKTWLDSENATELKKSLDVLRQLPLDEIAGRCLDELGVKQDSPLGKALMAAAKFADAHMAADEPAYHNRKHTADVVLAMMKIGRSEFDTREKVAEGLVAATIHDLGHPGGTNNERFELEDISIQIAQNVGILDRMYDTRRETIVDAVKKTAFVEAGEVAKEDYLSGWKKLPAVLRHADLFRSNFINAEAALEAQKELSKEFAASTERCPKLAEVAEFMKGPASQKTFAIANPCYLKSGASMRHRHKGIMEKLEQMELNQREKENLVEMS